jgi:hypothetical protein
MKDLAILLGVVVVVTTIPTLASSAEPQTKSDVCTLEDGKQVSLRYEIDDHDSTKLRMGQMWPQADRPMLLFSEIPLRIENSLIPIGAFSVYIIPDKKQWTLVVNSNVAGEYRPQQDLVRASMVTGDVSGRGAEHKVWFGHSASNQCEFRFYEGNTGAFAEFKEDNRTGS